MIFNLASNIKCLKKASSFSVTAKLNINKKERKTKHNKKEQTSKQIKIIISWAVSILP